MQLISSEIQSLNISPQFIFAFKIIGSKEMRKIYARMTIVMRRQFASHYVAHALSVTAHAICALVSSQDFR
jgi:hypothetical protein